MRIEKHYIKRVNLEEFADQHGLTLVISEQVPGSFMAYFKELTSFTYGSGNTPLAAVKAFVLEVSNKQYKNPTIGRIKVPTLAVGDCAKYLEPDDYVECGKD